MGMLQVGWESLVIDQRGVPDDSALLQRAEANVVPVERPRVNSPIPRARLPIILPSW